MREIQQRHYNTFEKKENWVEVEKIGISPFIKYGICEQSPFMSSMTINSVLITFGITIWPMGLYHNYVTRYRGIPGFVTSFFYNLKIKKKV